MRLTAFFLDFDQSILLSLESRSVLLNRNCRRSELPQRIINLCIRQGSDETEVMILNDTLRSTIFLQSRESEQTSVPTINITAVNQLQFCFFARKKCLGLKILFDQLR